VETSAERVLSDTRRQPSAKYRDACLDSDWRTMQACHFELDALSSVELTSGVEKGGGAVR